MNDPIPAWLHLTWAVAGVTVATGGVVWIVFVFYPYLLWSKKVMSRTLELAESSPRVMDKIQTEVAPLISDLKEFIRNMAGVCDRARIDRGIAAVEGLSKKLDELVARAERKGVDDVIDRL